jgi:hypothetical protein
MYKAIIKHVLYKLSGANRGSLYAIESLLNRAVGLPRVTRDVNVEAKQTLLLMDLGLPQMIME